MYASRRSLTRAAASRCRPWMPGRRRMTGAGARGMRNDCHVSCLQLRGASLASSRFASLLSPPAFQRNDVPVCCARGHYHLSDVAVVCVRPGGRARGGEWGEGARAGIAKEKRRKFGQSRGKKRRSSRPGLRLSCTPVRHPRGRTRGWGVCVWPMPLILTSEAQDSATRTHTHTLFPRPFPSLSAPPAPAPPPALPRPFAPPPPRPP